MDQSTRSLFLRVPDVVSRLATEGCVLSWNKISNWFEVLDGPLFEEQFNAMRCIRGKRKAGAADRPFARMHVYFELVRGDRWACTGSAFRAKECSTFERSASKVNADHNSHQRVVLGSQVEPMNVNAASASPESSTSSQEQHEIDPPTLALESDKVRSPKLSSFLATATLPISSASTA
jgi:hypothetical protein